MIKFVSSVLRSWCALTICTTALLAGPASGQTLGEQLVADARDGQLETFEFFAAALIAGGVEHDCELSGWFESFAARRAELLGAIPAGSAAERLQAIQAGLHGRLLTGSYQTEASDLRLALSRGDFNCLSSLAIYFDVCQAAGVETEIWLERGHVWLQCGGKTTDPLVIEPGLMEWTVRNSVPRNGARRITPIELLGKFYYNRGVELLQDRRFAEGLELLQVSLALDPADGDARANVAAGLNNWAVECCRAERFGEAAALIERGLAIEPGFAPLIANQRLVRERLGK